MKNKKQFLILLGIIVILSLALVTLLYINNRPMEDNLHTKPLEDDTLENVYLGSKQAPFELLLVFDYSCKYCDLWMEEVFPIIEDEFIKKGVIRFRTQSMVYLNESSLRLAEFDQNLKREYPDQYFDIFRDIMNPKDRSDHWGETTYLEEIIEEYQLKKEVLLREPKQDALSITRTYTRSLKIDAVPTIFINGQVIENAFDLEEIVGAM